MNAEIIHVTNHALARWRERAENKDCSPDEIVEIVKKSRQLKKNEFLPYPVARLPNSVYTVKDNLLFILEPVTLTEYRLVTVVGDPPKLPAKMTTIDELPCQMSASEERNLLLQEKKLIEKELAKLPKNKRKIWLTKLFDVEAKLQANKQWYEQENS
jgi:hypothetical protein